MATAEGVGGGAEVRLAGLTKTYADVAAVRDVSVTIRGGEFFTLLGPSGSGKTTTLMMIAGFVHPTQGAILVDGVSVASLPPQKRGLGMVFQNYAVFPHLTIFENIAFPLEVRKMAAADIRRRVEEMLDLVQLRGLEGRLPRQISGGQQQRVAVARALVFHPRVLLMDEPLGALDKKLRTQMQLELKQIQQRLHVTVIYVTHDQDEALTMSDRVAVMRDGRIEQVGTPVELYEQPANRFVADFLGDSNFIEGVVIRGGEGGRYLVRTSDGLEFWGLGAAAIPDGQLVSAAVRPEKLLLGQAASDTLNTFKGSVEDVIYAGDTTRYRIGIGPTGTLVVKVQNRLMARAFAPGESLVVSWNPGETRLFPGGSSAT